MLVKFLLLGNIHIRKYFESCHIITLVIKFKRVLEGCVNSNRINAEVCSSDTKYGPEKAEIDNFSFEQLLYEIENCPF